MKGKAIRDGWYHCPHCGKKLFPLRRDTLVRNLAYKCRACRRTFELNIPEPSAIAPSRAD